ncbi:DUF5339 family protein [Snodgrassella communis]|uniref:DUF5339 family protein n=1 Tax=Snodgrassella communis TaxID=2946699 RepID=UPI001EF57A3E|nr:DUF5339 family protein [Snodgrassella communis]
MIKKISSTAVFCLLALGLYGCDNSDKSNNIASGTASAASAPAVASETITPAATSEAATKATSVPLTTNATPQTNSSGIEECDKYFAAIDKLVVNLPENQKAIYHANYENFKKMAAEQPEQAKEGCKQAYDALPPQYR